MISLHSAGLKERDLHIFKYYVNLFMYLFLSAAIVQSFQLDPFHVWAYICIIGYVRAQFCLYVNNNSVNYVTDILALSYT